MLSPAIYQIRDGLQMKTKRGKEGRGKKRGVFFSSQLLYSQGSRGEEGGKGKGSSQENLRVKAVELKRKGANG